MASQSSLINRFSGQHKRRRIIDALLAQAAVCHSSEIAERIANVSVIEGHPLGATFVHQGDAGNDIFFILAGTVSVRVNGREIGQRHAGEHVGEMAAIDVHAVRSASILAMTETVTAKVRESDFSRIANAHPQIWRSLASTLGSRLRQRNRLVRIRNQVPKVFIGSSRESLSIAEALRDGMKDAPIDITVWSDGGVFRASRATLEDLERQVQSADFGILVLSPDDRIKSRGRERNGPRDNVIFELGMLIGALGRVRAYAIQPHGVDLKIPSDLFGIKPISYVSTGSENLVSDIIPACDELSALMVNLGPI